MLGGGEVQRKTKMRSWKETNKNKYVIKMEK